MQPTPRKNIPHLKDISDSDLRFIIAKSFVSPVVNIEVSQKYDGAGIRFGKDDEGKFFVETSRSGIIYDGNSFVNHITKNANHTSDLDAKLQRANHYRDIFNLLERMFKNSETIQSGTKVVAEMMYNPMAMDFGHEYIYVHVPYKKSAMGEVMTLAILEVLDSNNNQHKDSVIIKEKLIVIDSTNQVKIIDPSIRKFSVCMDYTEDSETLKNSLIQGFNSNIAAYKEGIVVSFLGKKYKVVNEDFLKLLRKNLK